MIPFVGMAAGFGVADGAGRHRPVVQHQVVGAAVAPAQQGMAGCGVQVGIVADDGRNAGAGFAAAGTGAAGRRRKRVDFNAPDVAGAPVVARYMVNHWRYEHRIAGLDRIFFAVGYQRAAAGNDIDFVFPFVNVVRAGAARLNHRVGQRNQRRVVVGADETGRRAGGVGADVVDNRFHNELLRGRLR